MHCRKRFNAMVVKYLIMKVRLAIKDLTEEETRAMAAAEKVLLGKTGGMPVDFISIEPAEWTDASLGWPEPGKSYAQVMTDGFRITGRSAGKQYECRVAGDNVRCKAVNG
jgi:hypothetical protein